MVYEERFNEVCAMVAGTNQASGFLLFPKDSGPPNSEVSVTYQFQEVLGQPALNSTTVIAGVPFITDLFLRGLGPVDRAILGWRYNVVELSYPRGRHQGRHRTRICGTPGTNDPRNHAVSA